MRIVLFQILLLIIGIAIVLFYKSVRARIFGRLSWKFNLGLAGLYIIVLTMLIPILSMLPTVDFIKPLDNKDQVKASSENLLNDLYRHHFPAEDDLAEDKGIYKNSSHTFKINLTKLSFDLRTNTGNYHILIKRKSVDDGEIDVSTYAAAQYIGEVNFTRQLIPPVISFNNGTLSLIAPNMQTLEFKQFNADFTVNQFENSNSGLFGMSTNFGSQIVYIHVPKSLEIDKGELGDRIQIIE